MARDSFKREVAQAVADGASNADLRAMFPGRRRGTLSVYASYARTALNANAPTRTDGWSILGVILPKADAERIAVEAEDRGLTPAGLLQLVAANLCASDLFEAVLGDG